IPPDSRPIASTLTRSFDSSRHTPASAPGLLPRRRDSSVRIMGEDYLDRDAKEKHKGRNGGGIGSKKPREPDAGPVVGPRSCFRTRGARGAAWTTRAP